MINSDNTLRIFDNFNIDNTLPKHSIKEKNRFNNIDGVTANESWGVPDSSLSINYSGKSRIGKKLFSFLKKHLIIKRTDRKKEFKNLLQFFTDICNNVETLSDLSKSIKYYEGLIKQANEFNQTALIESLESKMSIIKYEIGLYDSGVNKFINERQIADFYNKIDKDKGLKLTWIKNYIRLIPSDIIQIKKDVDDLKIFDNYVILHYDPDNIATDLTEKEKEIAKDPIIFGVIKNSKKLYFIADWKDDYCDLVLDDIVETLGEDVYKINNKTIKSYIDNSKLKKLKQTDEKHSTSST